MQGETSPCQGPALWGKFHHMRAKADKEPNPFVRGLQIAIKAGGWDMKPLSLAANLGETAVKDTLRNGSAPKVTTAYALAGALGMTIDEVIALGSNELAVSETDLPKPKPMIDVWNVAASAGDGLIAPDHEIVTERLAFPPDFLSRLTKTHPRHLAIIGVKGDSMAPTLNDDDIVMLDTTKCNLDWDGIFVLRFGDALHVKRVSRGRGDTIQIISDNQNYRTQELPRDEVHPVGRVIWFGKKV